MNISGFTIVRNAVKLYYPLKETILSLLPVVDEYIILVGNNDKGDTTLDLIKSINSDKIKIFQSVWDTDAYPSATILAQQTDEAKKHCSGDWLFYLQADEVIHEKDHDPILKRCEELFDDHEVEGLLFRYIHFWGDYDHAFTNFHSWYRNEIRIIRNLPEIHSWKDAQSFRVIPDFSKEKYLKKEGTRKLRVARVNADIYHYGWVRPPKLMAKKQYFFENYNVKITPDKNPEVISKIDFGPLGNIPVFTGSHPAVMRERMQSIFWKDQLNYGKKFIKILNGRKHENIKNRFLTLVEKIFFKKGIFCFKNYNLLKK